MVQARIAWEKKHGVGTFDPVIWIGERLTSRMLRVFNHSSHQTRFDTTLAWDAISRPHIRNTNYQEILTDVLISATASRRSSMVTMDPKAVKLIDAMSDAVGVPRKRGQRTLDLLTPDQKETFREIIQQ